ncbi:transmembrane protein 11 homolog, mitochondrial [Sergentomyia squamirostris]
MDLHEVNRLSTIDEVDQHSIFVVREVYNDGNAQEDFESELERALVARYAYIIIEPPRLGEETARWITVGNVLYKSSVTCGVLSMASGLCLPKRFILSVPLCVVSILFTGLYTLSWLYDPCCQYQVVKDRKTLEKVTKQEGKSSSALPVVLVYTKKSSTIERTVTLLAASFCAWQIYRSFN